jgi:uncharacterized protein with NRDE domain
MTESFHITSDSSPRAHRLVSRIAKEMCAELYVTYARKWPDFYKTWPSENAFVRAHWHFFVEEARATLARLLNSNIREDLKEEIFEALIRDQSLQPTRQGSIQVRMDI